MPPSSKRKRKEVAQQQRSNARNRGNGNTVVSGVSLDMLSPELRAELDCGPDDNATETAAQVPPPEDSAEPPMQVSNLSKGARRKLKQVQRKKELRDSLKQVMVTIHQHELPEGQLEVLRPMHQRGHRETKRQQLRRALKMERAGLVLSSADHQALYPGAGGAPTTEGTPEAAASSSDDNVIADGAHTRVLPHGGPAGSAPSVAAAAAVLVAAGGAQREREQQLLEEALKQLREAKQQKQRRPSKEEAATSSASSDSFDTRLDCDKRGGSHATASSRDRHPGAPVSGDATAGLSNGNMTAAAGGTGQQMPSSTPTAGASSPHRVVLVQRPEAMSAARLELPILGQEQELMELVAAHDVVILAGETGCGKTTQVPQFMYEAGYGCPDFPERSGLVGVTQPRRVAAVSTAERVSAELGEAIGGTVGFQVRHDRTVGPTTRIKFMTDGILLRELQSDLLLSRYSALLIDEAHERSLSTDLLIGMLSRIVPLRRKLWQQQQQQQVQRQALGQPGARSGSGEATAERVFPLKLIIMSATLRTADFTGNARLFKPPPPLIQVGARQYPVTVHFARRTEVDDYLGAALRKAVRIHRELPPGGILIFLTGQREVEQMCSRLRQQVEALRRRSRSSAAKGAADDSVDPLAGSKEQAGSSAAAADVDGEELAGSYGADQAEAAEAADGDAVEHFNELDDYDQMEEDEDEEETQMLGGDLGAVQEFSAAELAAAEARFEQLYSISRPAGSAAEGGAAASASSQGGVASEDGVVPPVHVLPLYAMMPHAEQARVFSPPPDGHRMIVVATNVAETSLTIPGIRYVVDVGRSKQRLLEQGGVLARYEVRWISQASAAQRAGRAGRTGPGHCYRLFSSAHFNDTFPQHSPPEVLNSPLEGVVLLMKSMGVDKVANFPFPTPPESESLLAATRCLVALSALEGSSAQTSTQGREEGGQLTALGRAMAQFPISPRHSRMLLEALSLQQHGSGAMAVASGAQATVGAPRGGGAAAARVLPLAVALAAAMSIESPFVHVDSIKAESSDASAAVDADGQPVVSKAAAAQQHRQQQHARAAHAALRSTDSDALSALSALLAFEAAGETDEFCQSHFLHARNLREAAALHRQLAAALALPAQRHTTSGVAGVSDDLAGLLTGAMVDAKRSGVLPGGARDALPRVLSADMRDCLRRAIAAGWADQVSRRVRSSQHVQEHQHSVGGARRAIRYQSCFMFAPEAAQGSDPQQQHVFLHPTSTLASASPELMIYSSLLRTTKRTYMVGVTAVEPTWLVQCGTPLCSLSAPLMAPPPAYRTSSDCVISWHAVSYGAHAWELPPHPQRHPNATERCAVFAGALLSGSVLPAFAQLRGALVLPPESAARPEMRAVARVGELVDALQRHGVDSRRSLATEWQANPSFLRRELASWLPAHRKAHLTEVWPVLLAEASSAAHQPTTTRHKKRAKKT